ncbi:MAG TPA: peptidoglycan DD-metalloendopeptidase family protein, partial [Candidatus Limnocylindrales bacterium]|nr:peptidoglycan DD-metalloendopeptidase family protein [Candidatus Limnocylindrales bacterium]
MSSTAYADDPTPRAVPAARAYPRSFTSYDALITYAGTIASAQGALDARADALRAEHADLSAKLESDGTNRGRGGRLFDVDGVRDTRSALASASARVNEVAALGKDLESAGALVSPAGAWVIPTDGEITQEFGPTDLWVEPARTFGGVAYAHFHEGVDIAGIWAADVVSPARGRVVFVGMMSDGAEVVVLAHDGGLVTLYAHLDAWNNPPTVAAGDEVSAGQKIGTTGL